MILLREKEMKRMRKKKDVPEVSGPMNWEELPEGVQVDWNAFGRVDLMFPETGAEAEVQPSEETSILEAQGEAVRLEVLRHAALAVLGQYSVIMWTEEKAMKRMPQLAGAVSDVVKAVCPGKIFSEDAVKAAVYQAVAMKRGEEKYANTVSGKWTGYGLTLADSVAAVLELFRKQLPDVYGDNPVIGWSIRNDGCTFIFRDGQKKVIGL